MGNATFVTPTPPKHEEAPEHIVALAEEERDLIRQYGELDLEIQGLHEKLAKTQTAQSIAAKGQELSDLGERIETLLSAGLGDLDDREERAGLFFAKVGKKRKETTKLDGWASKVHGFIGDSMWDIVTVGIGDLRKYLNPMQLAEVLKEEFTGRRSFKVEQIKQ